MNYLSKIADAVAMIGSGIVLFLCLLMAATGLGLVFLASAISNTIKPDRI